MPSVKYEDGIPKEIDSVTSHQTDDNIPLAQIEDDMIKVARDVLNSTELISSKTKFIINPTGRFVTGGPHGDAD